METAPKTFYSTSPGLSIVWKRPFRAVADGKAMVIDEPSIDFTPIGQEKFGYYVAREPEVISYLEQRARTHGDVMTAERYNYLSEDPNMRAKFKEQENERLTEELNRLKAIIDAQKKGLPTSK